MLFEYYPLSFMNHAIRFFIFFKRYREDDIRAQLQGLIPFHGETSAGLTVT